LYRDEAACKAMDRLLQIYVVAYMCINCLCMCKLCICASTVRPKCSGTCDH